MIEFNTTVFRRLEIQSCKNVSLLAIQRLFYNSCRLEYVNCCYCEQITDCALTILANSNPRLKFLNIGYNHLITTVGIRDLLSACVALEVLFCIGCDNIHIQELEREFPSVQINPCVGPQFPNISILPK